MCGIAGWLGTVVGGELVASRMVKALRHRGPDAHAIRLWPEATLVHTRLSIIDSSGTSVYSNDVIQFPGSIPPFEMSLLAQKGSLRVTRPSLVHFIADRKDLVTAANHLFDIVGAGGVKVVANRYALRDAANAHRDPKARHTTGSTILIA